MQMSIEVMATAVKSQISLKAYSLTPNPAHIGKKDILLLRSLTATEMERAMVDSGSAAKGKSKAMAKASAPTMEYLKKRLRDNGHLG